MDATLHLVVRAMNQARRGGIAIAIALALALAAGVALAPYWTAATLSARAAGASGGVSLRDGRRARGWRRLEPGFDRSIPPRCVQTTATPRPPTPRRRPHAR